MTDISARAYAAFLNSLMTIDDLAAAQPWPINAAEKTLHELEVYKTPLLPSRLKGAPIPEMFIPKKNRPIVLMHDRDRERKKGKGKSKMKDRDGVNGTKPYAGEGGMKKWLARRMREEDVVRVHEAADKEKEKEQAMDEDENAEAEAGRLREQQKKEREEEAKRKKELDVRPIPKAPAFEPQPTATREMSLRVGRSRARNHIERPISRRTNKFSAAFEDDEDAMDDDRAALEEAAKKATLFEIPVGFTFAKEVKSLRMALMDTSSHHYRRHRYPKMSQMQKNLPSARFRFHCQSYLRLHLWLSQSHRRSPPHLPRQQFLQFHLLLLPHSLRSRRHILRLLLSPPPLPLVFRISSLIQLHLTNL